MQQQQQQLGSLWKYQSAAVTERPRGKRSANNAIRLTQKFSVMTSYDKMLYFTNTAIIRHL